MVVVKDIASIIGVVDESETDEGMERDAIFYESESLPTRQFCYAEVERLIKGTVWWVGLILSTNDSQTYAIGADISHTMIRIALQRRKGEEPHR